MPQDIRDTWLVEFVEPTMEGHVNKLFKKKGGVKIRNFMFRAKIHDKRPSHVNIEDWELMKERFKDQSYIDKCSKVQVHR